MSSAPEVSAAPSAEPLKSGLNYNENVNYWANRWDQGKIGFHRKNINPILLKNLERLTGNEPKRIFVPLCGKTLDLPFLYQQGHQVFGVEAVAKAIDELEAENSIGLKFDPVKSLYQTADGRLKIYLGDIFTCPFEKYGPFDCVWDRGSFIALEYQFRPEYMRMMQQALGVKGTEDDGGSKPYHDFRYLMETVDYDRNNFGGPPRAVDENDIQEYFGDWCDFQVVMREPDLEGNVRRVPNIGPKVDTVVYFLTPKQ